MGTHSSTAHGRCDSRTIRHEPDFDAERVIWDADYRRRVIEALRQWHLHQDQDSDPTATDSLPTDMKAA
jgi:hypothetical protein